MMRRLDEDVRPSLMLRASPDFNLLTRSAAMCASHPGTRRQVIPARPARTAAIEPGVGCPGLNCHRGQEQYVGCKRSPSRRRGPTCGPSSRRSACRGSHRLSPGLATRILRGRCTTRCGVAFVSAACGCLRPAEGKIPTATSNCSRESLKTLQLD